MITGLKSPHETGDLFVFPLLCDLIKFNPAMIRYYIDALQTADFIVYMR